MSHGLISFSALGLVLFSMALLYLIRKLRAIQGPALSISGVLTALAVLLLFLSAGSQLLPHFLRKNESAQGLPHLLRWLGYISLGLIFQWLFYGLIDDLVFWLSKKTSNRIKRRPFYPASARKPVFVLILVLGAAISTTGLWYATRTPDVKKISITVPGLPPSFSGLRIVQLSDIHIGPTLRSSWLQRVVDKVNDFHPDLIVLTGDLVEGHEGDAASEILPLKKLSAPLGVYVVLGNHEYHTEPTDWARQYRDLGFKVLQNENVRISQNSQSLVLAGISDYRHGAHRAPSAEDIGKALAGASSTETVILLSHQPKVFEIAERAGVKLQLSGHTHGGQFFPFSLFARLAHKYFLGLYERGDSRLYVHPGTGYWGPPLRFGVPAEISELTLHSQQDRAPASEPSR